MEQLKRWSKDLLDSWRAVHPASWLLLLAGLVLTGYEAVILINTKLEQRPVTLDMYQKGTVPSDLSGQQIFDLALQLDANSQYRDALQLYNYIETHGDREFQEQVKYNMGYIYLREAAALWNTQGVWAYSELNTLVNLAKDYYRQVLRINPNNWDARFNYEYALRITPPPRETEKADWTGQKSSVHAVLPGIPGGGP